MKKTTLYALACTAIFISEYTFASEKQGGDPLKNPVFEKVKKQETAASNPGTPNSKEIARLQDEKTKLPTDEEIIQKAELTYTPDLGTPSRINGYKKEAIESEQSRRDAKVAIIDLKITKLQATKREDVLKKTEDARVEDARADERKKVEFKEQERAKEIHALLERMNLIQTNLQQAEEAKKKAEEEMRKEAEQAASLQQKLREESSKVVSLGTEKEKIQTALEEEAKKAATLELDKKKLQEDLNGSKRGQKVLFDQTVGLKKELDEVTTLLKEATKDINEQSISDTKLKAEYQEAKARLEVQDKINVNGTQEVEKKGTQEAEARAKAEALEMERKARESAEQERIAREAAEKQAKEAAEKEAKEKEAKEAAEKEAAEKKRLEEEEEAAALASMSSKLGSKKPATGNTGKADKK
jgi:hypothetical protein